MAGDWIKMRIGLPDDPAVVKIAKELRIKEDEVIGKLLRIWGWADQNTATGDTDYVDYDWVDKFVRKKGFGAAMAAVGWLQLNEQGLVFPEFTKHNGQSAKLRLNTAERQRKSRASHKHVTEKCDTSHKKPVTREEKRREDKNKKPSPPAGLHDALIKYFTDEYLKATGVSYVFKGGRDGKAVKELLRDYEPPEIKAMIAAMFDDEWGKANATIHLLCDKQNKWKQATASPVSRIGCNRHTFAERNGLE